MSLDTQPTVFIALPVAVGAALLLPTVLGSHLLLPLVAAVLPYLITKAHVALAGWEHVSLVASIGSVLSGARPGGEGGGEATQGRRALCAPGAASQRTRARRGFAAGFKAPSPVLGSWRCPPLTRAGVFSLAGTYWLLSTTWKFTSGRRCTRACV